MKKTCSDCKARFEINTEEIEEGDFINCPECNLEYAILLDEADPKKLKIIESKKLDLGLVDDTEDEEESEEDFDFE